MWNNTNPAELFSGTTWELITAGKYIQSGSTPLQTGGSNSVSIAKTNLPNIKLKVDSFSSTISNHYHYIASDNKGTYPWPTNLTYIVKHGISQQDTNGANWYGLAATSTKATLGKTSDSGAGNTGNVSPYTESLGSGTALNIQPTYITLKFWKRLS